MLIEFKQCNHIIKACHGVGVRKIFHVGAHTGEEAVTYSENGVERVVWFEANETLVPQLSRFIAQFPMEQIVIPYALWNQNEILTFKVTNNFQSSSFFDLQAHSVYYPGIVVTEEKQVQALRLDSLIELQPPGLPFSDFDFINIDTQGSELAVLQGLGQYILQPSIKGIYLEVNRESLYKDIPMIGKIDAYLAQCGFSRIITKWTREGWGDAFYLKNIEVEF